MKLLAAIALVLGVTTTTMALAQVPAHDTHGTALVSPTSEISDRLSTLEIAQAVKAQQLASEAIEREKGDLTAQQSMATSTTEIAKLTAIQVWIGVVTALGLALSIGFTWLSIAQTRRVIKDNQKYSEIELRAYLGLCSVTVIDLAEGAGAAIRVAYRNYGSSPAINVRAWLTGERVVGFPQSRDINLPGQLDYARTADLPPQSEAFVTRSLGNLTADDLIQYEGQTASEGYTIVLLYDDVFGGHHVCRIGGHRSGKGLKFQKRNLAIDTLLHRDIPPDPVSVPAPVGTAPDLKWPWRKKAA